MPLVNWQRVLETGTYLSPLCEFCFQFGFRFWLLFRLRFWFTFVQFVLYCPFLLEYSRIFHPWMWKFYQKNHIRQAWWLFGPDFSLIIFWKHLGCPNSEWSRSNGTVVKLSRIHQKWEVGPSYRFFLWGLKISLPSQE